VLEQVKLVQLQNVGLSRHMSALIPLPPEPDDSKSEHFDWTQLWRSGITLNLPFSVTVGEQCRDAVYLTLLCRFILSAENFVNGCNAAIMLGIW